MSRAPCHNDHLIVAAELTLCVPCLTGLCGWLQLLRALFGDTMAEMTLLASQRVVPRKLLDAGFNFQHPAIADILTSTLREPYGEWE